MIFGQKMHFLPKKSSKVKIFDYHNLEVSQKLPKTSFGMGKFLKNIWFYVHFNACLKIFIFVKILIFCVFLLFFHEKTKIFGNTNSLYAGNPLAINFAKKRMEKTSKLAIL